MKRGHVVNLHPEVSVISLTYNRKAQIVALLQALRKQDYPWFEVIVIDNGSTDGIANPIREGYLKFSRGRAPFPEIEAGCSGCCAGDQRGTQ